MIKEYHTKTSKHSKLIHDDCFNYFPEISDKSIDAIIADLPYGTTACEWDTVLPLENLWIEFERISKLNAAIILTASQPFTTELINSNRKMFRYEMVWAKNMPTGAFNANKMPMKSHENILVFYRSLPTYNPQKTKRTDQELKRFMKRPVSTKIKNSVYGSFERKVLGRDAILKNPNTLLMFDVVNGRNGDKQPHPTQKPVDLIRYLVKTYTNEGDLVLDNTMGSGTTAIACDKTNRRFIGIEKDKEYYDSAVKRFEQHISQKTLF